MVEELFSFSWVTLIDYEMKKGPTEKRKNKVSPNYWDWINHCKQGLTLKCALVLVDTSERYVYIDIENGEVLHTYIGSEQELQEAEIVLAGTKTGWLEIIKEKKEPAQLIMSGKINLTKGSVSFFYRRIYYFSELLRCFSRVPLDEPESETSALTIL